MTKARISSLFLLLSLTTSTLLVRCNGREEAHSLLVQSSNLRAAATKANPSPSKSRSLSFLSWLRCEESNCRTVSPLKQAAFDIDKYIEKSWFIQKQQINPYQSINDLYCVVATYNKRDDGFIQVLNTANVGSVGGDTQTPQDPNACSITQLCAQQIDAGQLQVAPCALKPFFCVAAGPYWVLAVGDDGAGGYSWAIVSGGQPKVEREEVNGTTYCTTKGFDGGSFLDTNGSGLWLFSRNRDYNATEIAIMEDKLVEMGIYTGDLKNVVHSGCAYPDFIKT